MSTASGARSERASEVLLEALPQLLNSGTPPPPHVISRLFHAVLTASAPSGGTLQATSSTETQTFKLRALASLASAATTQPLDVLCSPEAVGAAIAQCMDCMKERDRALKLQALQTLNALMKVTTADCLAFFLPGVTTTLVNVIAGDFKHGDAVRAAAVESLVAFFCLVMRSPPSSQVPVAAATAGTSPMRVHRTTDWSALTISQIVPRLTRCFTPQADTKPKLRLALALQAANIIHSLPDLANAMFGPLLDSILFCYEDPLAEVAAAVVDATKTLKLDSGTLGKLLRSKLAALPLLARSTTADDGAKSVAFRVLLSLVRLIASHAGALELVLDLHLSDISLSLLALFQVDERASALPEPEPTGVQYPRKEFTSFHDQNLARLAHDFVLALGALGPSLLLLVDHFLSFCTVRNSRATALLIIAGLVTGAANRLAPETRAQLRQEFANAELWETDPTLPLPLPCYTMEALGSLVQVCDAEELKREVLPSFLYRLIEQLGGAQAAKAYAYVTLTRLAHGTDAASVPLLLATNADYLIDELALRLRSFEAHPGVTAVLLGLLHHCPSLPFSLLDDTLELLLRALDAHHRRPAAATQILNVLQAIVRLLGTSIPIRAAPPLRPHSPMQEVQPPEKHETTPEEVREFFLKVAAEKEKKNMMKGVDLDEPSQQRVPEPDEELQLSKEETALLKCVEKMRHFVTRSEVSVAQASIAVQLTALPYLSRMQGAVLPTIHSLWQPLVTRISAAEGSPSILEQVLQTVSSLVKGAPDFLLPKFNAELLPALSSLLRKQQAVDPVTQQSHSELSPAFRLQLAALKCMSDTLCMLSAAPSVRPAFDLVGEACAPYLTQQTPTLLQEAAMEILKNVLIADPDSLWLQLITWAGVSLPPPPTGCQEIRIPLAAQRHPAARNARLLLGFIAEREKDG